MRAIAAVLAPGLGPALAERDLPDEPGPGEALVAMERAPVNPADLLVLDGRYAFDLGERPVLGAEGCGRVLAVGAGVDRVAPGDRVLPLDRGNWTSFRLVKQDRLIRASASLSPGEAATLRINPATAWRLVDEGAAATGMKAGDRIIQNGGRSMVARWVR